MDEHDNIIFAYTDQEAIADGVLVPFAGESGVNRVTRAVFDHFVTPMGKSPVTGPVINITPLQTAIRAMLKILPDEGGWRTGMHEGKTLWLVPNELQGFTLMFPEDY